MTLPPDMEDLEEWQPKFSEEERARVDEAVARILADPSPVRILRTEFRMTQAEMAAMLGTTQSRVSKLEKKSEPDLRTMRQIVEQKGGKLRIIAQFGDTSIDLVSAD